MTVKRLLEIAKQVLKIYPIIEGDGEVQAVPKLLYKILRRANCHDVHIGTVQNAHGRTNLTRPNGLESFVKRVLKEADCGAVLILIDAEKECPLELARSFFHRITALGASRPIVIAFAKCMYENWLLASIETMQGRELPKGRLGIKSGTQPPEDIEGQTGAKGWLTDQMPRGIAYKETLDQLALTQMMDIELVHKRSQSFRRLCNAVSQAIDGIKQKQVFITPSFDRASKNIISSSANIKVPRKRRPPKR